MDTNIKTFDDVLAAVGKTPEQFAEETKGDTPDEVAYKQLKLIAKVFNGDWVADWSNYDQWKYWPYFYYVSGVGLSYYDFDIDFSDTGVAARLCFKSREIAVYVGKQFIEIYRVYLS